MATLKALLFLVAASSNVLTVEGIDREAPIPGSSVEMLNPRDAPNSLDGTIELVSSKAKQLSPRWDQIKPYRIECADGKRWKKAHRWYILDGIMYLEGLSAKPTIGPGPGNCSRVSCSYEAAIWWCNDNSEKLELNSFNEIVDGAEAIMDECLSYGLIMDRMGGQAFMPGNWNVIVRQDKDHC
ncbi:hypothetical protein E4U35_007634 [Claviceps purpurea]|nr:hypothetical protein E4U11_000247 [Claviceps purpurea]KAG6178542.1 hypothetical protein E4U10_008186 [Claviceps purpurea]KAG6197121.1 hypothetical protein E4U35_007634 [Claviceps purpurea]